jgi:hypothetical protein
MKVNKIFMVAVVGLSAVLLGGCLKKEDTAGTKSIKKEEIAEVMEEGKPIHCVMSTSEGGTIETWTKGEKTKAYGANMGGGMGMGYMISDKEWTYMWAEGATEGSKYPVIDEETPRSEGEDFQGEMPNYDMQQELEESRVDDYKYECDEQNIPDSTFVPPVGVEFVNKAESMGVGLEDFKQE